MGHKDPLCFPPVLGTRIPIREEREGGGGRWEGEEEKKAAVCVVRRSQGHHGLYMWLHRLQLTSEVLVLPTGKPIVFPGSPYHVRDVIDPGDNRLDEGFGVILDFSDRHSFNIGQIGPKPQDSAQGSTKHFPSQDVLLGPANRRNHT